MAKPIFILRVPIDGFREVLKQSEDLNNRFNDYHILYIPAEQKEISFECYNSDEANEIDFKALQEMVIELTKVAMK